MKELMERVESLTTGIGLLVLLHSIIGWYSFVETLRDTSELCDVLGISNCEYNGWLRIFFGLMIETMIGFILFVFNLQNLNLESDQEEGAVSQKRMESMSLGEGVDEGARVVTTPSGEVLAVAEVGRRIRQVYKAHNASKVEDVPWLLEKYAGKEGALYEKICSKYLASGPGAEDWAWEVEKKRCKYWGDSGRCKEYHTNALYCDEHMEIVSRNEMDDDLVDIFRLPGKD